MFIVGGGQQPRTPIKLVVAGGDGSATLSCASDESTTQQSGGWANELLSLRNLAVALEQLAGPGPDPYQGPSDELFRWFDRYGRATEILAEVANRDAPLLRSLAGPPCDDEEPPPPGRELLLAAAIHVERR